MDDSDGASGGASGVRSCPSGHSENKRLLRVFLRSGINKSERDHQGPRLDDISTIHNPLLPLLMQFAATFETSSAPLPLPELPFCVMSPPKVVQENTKKQALPLDLSKKPSNTPNTRSCFFPSHYVLLAQKSVCHNSHNL